MLLALFLQGNLLLSSAHIVEKDWQDVWMLSCLSSDLLSQDGVSGNGQDKQNHPACKVRMVSDRNLLVLTDTPRLQDGFHGFLVHKLVNVP